MNYYKYHLQDYTNTSSRHECPQCHDPRSFTYYVDENNKPLHPTVGRCDHENRCGYHYTPSQYFRDNPDSNRHYSLTPTPPPKPRRPPSYIDKQLVLRSLSFDSNLCEYLCRFFPSESIQRAWGLYALGGTKKKEVIYWQIDINGRVRTGKVINYSPENGHRIKKSLVGWIHAKCKKMGIVDESFNLVQCLFGEHLLTKYPSMPVAIVEAEKTAVIASLIFSDYIWLSVGGKGNLSHERLRVLAGRKVIIFPDADAFNDWNERAKEIRAMGIDCVVSDYVERTATTEQKERGIDIADLIIDDFSPPSTKVITAYCPTIQLERMKAKNQAIGELVEALDLVVIDDDYEPF